jgi:hypothetical protein
MAEFPGFIGVRVTVEERQALKRLAAAQRQTMSDTLRGLIEQTSGKAPEVKDAAE